MLDRTALALRGRGTGLVLGRLQKVTGQLLEAYVPGARIGETIEIEREGSQLMGEVVGFRDNLALAMALSDVRGVTVGALVRRRGGGAEVPIGDQMIGRVIDVFGRPLDGGEPIFTDRRTPVDQPARRIDERTRIDRRFDTGVRVIDGLLTCGRGQRVGIFAGSGVGKTVLMRSIISHSQADVTVVGLIGERGCEVYDLLGSSARQRSVVVAATSDRPPLERARGAQAATAIAEYFRDQGANVLLVIDSLTRYAMALREIGLAAGELPATKGYPPSVFAAMPRLLERVLPMASGGSITGIYTVLVEGDDLNDPVADSARSLLDGHIVLSRDLAARGHFPAVDVLQSASRVIRQVAQPDALELADRARAVLAIRKQVDELRSLGAYIVGTNPEYDQALALGARIDKWARQIPSDQTDYEANMAALAQAMAQAERS